MITIYITLMSGEVLPYVARGNKENKAKFLTHKENIKEKVLTHLQLDIKKHKYQLCKRTRPNTLIVELFHDDDDEKLQEVHIKHIEKMREKGKYVPADDIYDSYRRIFKQERDRNRYYEDGSIVRAFVKEFNLKKSWSELKDDN